MSLRRTVSHSESFDVPASVVWAVLVDWASIADWMPDGIIVSLEMDGTGIGAIRHIVTRKGVHIAERLDRADERRGRLELSILEPLPWNMLSYTAAAQLDELGPQQCRLRWEGRFTLPDEARAVDDLVDMLRWSYRAMFAGIRQQSATASESQDGPSRDRKSS